MCGRFSGSGWIHSQVDFEVWFQLSVGSSAVVQVTSIVLFSKSAKGWKTFHPRFEKNFNLRTENIELETSNLQKKARKACVFIDALCNGYATHSGRCVAGFLAAGGYIHRLILKYGFSYQSAAVRWSPSAKVCGGIVT